MYTEEELSNLESEEHVLTEEAIVAMLLVLGVAHDELEKEVRDFYSKYGTNGVVTWQQARKWTSNEDHTRRLTALLLAVGGTFGAVLDKLVPQFEALLSGVVTKESEFFDVSLPSAKVLYCPWGADDLNWVARLEDDVDLWQWNISKSIEQGLLKRQTVESVLAELDKRFFSMKKVLKRLALTESTAIGSIARKQIFKELGITKYQFYAREDERTCDECGALHGLVFPISAYEVGKTASPIHAHCRCWEVPILD